MESTIHIQSTILLCRIDVYNMNIRLSVGIGHEGVLFVRVIIVDALQPAGYVCDVVDSYSWTASLGARKPLIGEGIESRRLSPCQQMDSISTLTCSLDTY